MSRSRTQPYHVTEHGGNKYASLEEAQAALLEPLAEAIAAVIRARLESGELKIGARKDGDEQ